MDDFYQVAPLLLFVIAVSYAATSSDEESAVPLIHRAQELAMWAEPGQLSLVTEEIGGALTFAADGEVSLSSAAVLAEARSAR